MENNVNDLIKKFVVEIKNQYPALYIETCYDNEEDLYEIWHNDANLEYGDKHFKKTIGLKAQEILFNNNIFNFYFGYNHLKSLELENKVYKTQFDKLNITVKGEIKDVSHSHKNDDYKINRYIKNTHIDNNKAEIKLEMNCLDKDDNSKRFSMRNDKENIKVNWQNKDISQNIRGLELAS